MTSGINSLDRVVLQKCFQGSLGLLHAIDPQCVAKTVPNLCEAFLVGVRVLDHLPGQPIWVRSDQPIADRAAVILDVDPHTPRETNTLQGCVDDIGEMVERVIPR